MTSSFDTLYDRRPTDSVKWNYYPPDVLPMWVADMDFAVPLAVTRALRERIEHPIFGYSLPSAGLVETIQAYLDRRYGWQVDAEAIVIIPGVVVGFNLAAQALAKPVSKLVIHTPAYPPFFAAAENAALELAGVDLVQDAAGIYRVNWGKFEAAIADHAGLFLLCNPQNPVGRVFDRDELTRMAEICAHYGVPICADEIHADIVYSGHCHTPIATLSPEIGTNTVTLMAPSKTFNIPGLEFSFAIIPNPDLRAKFNQTRRGLVGAPNLLGMTAAKAAYAEGQTWLEELLEYLEGNRDFLVEFVKNRLPAAKMTLPEGTYLAWIDLNAYHLQPTPGKFLLENARVGLNEGTDFGGAGKGFVRFNFACPRQTLLEGLNRMQRALENISTKT